MVKTGPSSPTFSLPRIPQLQGGINCHVQRIHAVCFESTVSHSIELKNNLSSSPDNCKAEQFYSQRIISLISFFTKFFTYLVVKLFDHINIYDISIFFDLNYPIY